MIWAEQMQAVLGIDAAWTLSKPSGVALVTRRRSGWKLIAAAASYQDFHALADRYLPGSAPDASALLTSASVLCGGEVDLIAIDMPLAYSPIVGRRISDDAVSREYGARKCGTHTPSELRPGRISDELRKGFDVRGYALLTESPASTGVIEVYPHPALVELAGASVRLPYKASKVRSYWPSATLTERRARLHQQWFEIVTLLEKEIEGVRAKLPRIETGLGIVKPKAYEDMLDAIVCAWVGVCALEGRAIPFGDGDSAIWVPRPFKTSPPLE